MMHKFKAIFSLALLLAAAILFIANNPPMEKDYDKLWKQIDSLDKLRQPQAAMKVVDEIYQSAKKDENIPQTIKAQLYRLKLSSEFEEDYLVKAIQRLETEIGQAESPEKEILHSVLGELYMKYYRANRYKILERSTTSDFEDEDIQTWDARKLIGEAQKQYLLSIENEKELQRVSIIGFEAILEKEKTSDAFRPTLFDFLAYRAIEFFTDDEADIKVATMQFIPSDPKYFGKAETFVGMDFIKQYPNSNTAQVLEIYQRILKFHFNDKNPKASIDADLKRLDYLYQKAVVAKKDSLYMQALSTLITNYKYSEESTAASFALAKFHNQQAMNYSPLVSEDYRWENQKAKSICEDAIKAFPKSDGAQNCETLLQQIVDSEMMVKVEAANIPGKPALGMITWKNQSKVWFRLVKMDYSDFNEIVQGNRSETIANNLATKKYSEAWSMDLPNEMDFQLHSAEFKIPAVAEGFYVLLASDQENFESGKNKLAWAEFWSTNLSYISQRLLKGGYDIFVLNRESGKPLADVTVNVYKRDYDYRNRSYETRFISGEKTDANGFLNFAPDKDVRGSVSLELLFGNDKYVPTENFYLNASREQQEKTQLKTFFFTDRAIYRPGQLVYFKAIVLEKTGDKYEINPGSSTKVEFFDANNQLVSSLNLLTNEYGSANGSFTIPTGLLSGEMRIKNENGNANIRVEEYKRPKFEVTFLPVTGSYKLNEEITLTGNAKAYAGNMVDGANVKYRVVRNTYFPGPYFSGGNMYYRGMWQPAMPVEISTGETISDAAGNFEISFTAIPDYSFDEKRKPSFSYVITADVTDINGETQSATQDVNVGSEALVLDVSIPENVNIQKPTDFMVSAKNLNGEKQESLVAIKIYKLIQPEGILNGRLWQQPDEFLISENEFRKDFPANEFKDERDPKNWEKGELVFETNINTSTDSIFKPENFKNWSQGKYRVELKANDVFGTIVNAEMIFTLFDPEAKMPPFVTYHWFEAIKTSGEPGEEAEFLLGTSAKNVSVLYEIQFRGETIQRQWIKLSKKQQLFKIPILEEYRGNFTFQYTFVINNRVYSGNEVIKVPFTNKKLDLAFETFRSDLEPGSREKWIVTIRNKNGDKVAAEMLASMYDASLDAFLPHNWSFDLYPTYSQIIQWQAANNFSVSQGNSFDFNPTQFKPFIFRQYDRLNWFGLDGYSRYYAMDAVGGMKSRAGVPEISAMKNEGNTELMEDEEVPPVAMQTAIAGEPEAVAPPKEEPLNFQLRRDFNETAFFYPELKTNENGDVVIEFTLPESFTKWKFMGLGYTKDLMTGMMEQEFTAAKKLMIVPNAPRFFRAGDTLNFSAKISNLSDENLEGQTSLVFYDAITMKEVSSELFTGNNILRFNVEKGLSTSVNWEIVIPENYGVLTYRVKANTRSFSDGEEKSVPVLPNRMMVTESMAMPIGGNETKSFSFEKLVNSGKSQSLENYRLTLEFASNPAWYAVQALPVMADPEYRNAISAFSAFFANSLAFHITNKNPEIKRVFDSWKMETPESFLSKLEKNQELKQVLLEQTPWVLDAKNETERKQRIALLFDLNNMQNRLDNSIRLLEKFQKPGGGFCWMDDMRESRYITQMIVQGIGKLDYLGVIDAIGDDRVSKMMNNAVRYLDREIQEDFDDLKKRNPDKMDENHLSSSHIQYLYARSFFRHIMINPSNEVAYNYFENQAEKYWQKQNIYLQGMIALALDRNKKPEVPALIVKSLKDRSLNNAEMGMYWRSESGYFWYEAPIETQAMMIEVFDEVGKDEISVEKMKVWLLKQKQTQDWKTNRATAEAVYALLGRGVNLLASNEPVKIKVGGEILGNDKIGKVEAGTGYFQTSWDAAEITPAMGNVELEKTDAGIAWGAMYWQYFETLDKITQHSTGLSVEKQLFVEKDSKAGRVIEPLNDGDVLILGEKVMVRIEIRVDRDMEFVHLRDMRASSFEPVNVLSGYQYRGGLGYYQTTKDASTDFFFDYLHKGTYVFEYPLITSQTGEFSNGITTLQCMYAPEFSSHSQGVRVKVSGK